MFHRTWSFVTTFQEYHYFFKRLCKLPSYLPLLRSETLSSLTVWAFRLCAWYSELSIFDCQYASKDGYVSDVLVGIYADYAMSGFGGIIQEATGIVPEGRICDL